MFACLKHLWTSSWVATETETTEGREKAQFVTWMSIGRKKETVLFGVVDILWSNIGCVRGMFRTVVSFMYSASHQLSFICNFISCYMTSAVLKKKKRILCEGKSYATNKVYITQHTTVLQFCSRIHFKAPCYVWFVLVKCIVSFSFLLFVFCHVFICSVAMLFGVGWLSIISCHS